MEPQPVHPSQLVLFPVVPPESDGPNPGKAPRDKGWRSLKASVPVPSGYNTGVLCGRVSDVFVVDVDVKNGIDGFSSLLALDPTGQGDGLDTYTVQTPTGGAHFYFQYPNFEVRNMQGGRPAPGVDIRGDGGFVVGPGSKHKNGGTYTVALAAPIQPAPVWLLEALRKYPVFRGEGIPVEPVSGPRLGGNMSKAKAFLDGLPPRVAGQGLSDQIIRNISIKLVRNLALPLDVAERIFEEHYNVRCSPPWDYNEVHRNMWNVATKFDTPVDTAATSEFETVLRNALAPVPVKAAELFEPSKAVRNGDLKKCAFSDLVRIFCSHPDWEGVLRWDEIHSAVIAINPPLRLESEKTNLSAVDVSNIRVWLECVGSITMPALAVREAIEAAAKSLPPHNAIKEYLECLDQGDPKIYDGAALRLFGNDSKVCDEMLKRMMVSAVRRVLEPGCKVDTMLVLVGSQGFRKSSFASKLFGEWFRDQMPPIEGRDASHALQGYWGIELSELDRIARAESSTVKDFLSRRIDDYRAFGTGDKVHCPRHCVFIGTTNEESFLRDSTGNRRFWPIYVSQRIPDFDRDALWAAAYTLAKSGYSHYFDPDMESEVDKMRGQFMEDDVWQSDVVRYLKGKDWVNVNDVLTGALHMTVDKKDYKAMNRVIKILRNLGCTRRTKTSGDANYKGWDVPLEISGAPMPKVVPIK